MSSWPSWVVWLIVSTAVLGGLTLLLWALFWDRARGRRRCPKCWYDMAGTAGSTRLVCPECGKSIRNEKQLRRTRRRWRWAVAGLLALGCGIALPAARQVQSRTWASLTPTRVLLWATFSDQFKRNKAIRDELSYRRFASSRDHGVPLRFVSGLIDRLNTDPDPRNRDYAASLLAWVGSRDSRITTALLQALRSPEPDAGVRARIIRSFRIYLADADRVLPVLTSIVTDASEDPEVRAEACGVLSSYGQQARSAQGVVLAAMKPGNPIELRCAAAYALGKIGADHELAVPALLDALHDPPPRFGWNSESSLWRGIVQSLGEYKGSAPLIAPALIGYIEPPVDPAFWEDVIRAIGNLGPPAHGAIPALEAIVADPNWADGSRELAKTALTVIRGEHDDMPAALAETIRSGDAARRLIAVSLLAYWGRDAAPVFLELVEELDPATSPDVLELVCFRLEHIHEYAYSALPALRRLRQHWPDSSVDYAIDSIERMETGKPKP